MENQKIINLLDKIDTDSKHFATKKWYIPSRQILVPRTYRGRPPPTSPGSPLKVLVDHLVDVPV